MAIDTLDIKVKMIKGFADKTRLQILECLKEQEKTVSQIVEEIKGKQSNISQHLACLKGCGIITGRQEGKFMYYSIRNEQVKMLLNMFDLVLGEVEEQVADCDKNDQCLSNEGVSCSA
ncbi:ArsR family transcriptional regulator [Heyndrickxia coagulans]|uniref:ArsR/SmtB family transcription factor n=1 Tax=Heyndrickxia coagulans TaxID=1398 RepID=UPI000D728E43|nr:metalloregulator ArsR/SmtB family transcription factor [Heyndrickxia coagulans]AWP38382.1 transcriptional regulator [Heyndrickxia coagulans]QDI60689.1 ArsR family transcriptional regulator [Heyndrickxia coagulans]